MNKSVVPTPHEPNDKNYSISLITKKPQVLPYGC